MMIRKMKKKYWTPWTALRRPKYKKFLEIFLKIFKNAERAKRRL